VQGLPCGKAADPFACAQMLATVLRTGQVLALFDPGHPERSLSEGS
jgi:hypothetical protein